MRQHGRVAFIGLTGGIGAGKSAVAELLAAHGAVVVDADRVAREVVAPGTPGLAAVAEAFGPGVLAPDGSLDRPALGAIVFADPAVRRRLEAITHPLIGAETLRRIERAGDAPVIVHDVPLLVEAGLTHGYDDIVVVEAPREVRLERLAGRGVARADAEARMASQATDAQRRAVATVVVDNAGDREALRRQVDALWGRWTAGRAAAGA
ncbi:MAG: dephospho-CoA kinase [Mycobacterium sp.]|nr:dephospho-CoA kinase [Mycobacterium sp.]